MSVSVGRNLVVLIGGAAVMALIASLLLHGRADPRPDGSSATLRAPSQALDVIESRTPARSAVEVSRRLYATSRTVVLADARDREAQKSAITAATSLRVPVLIDDQAAPAEIDRLRATTVLTFGHTREVPGAEPGGAVSALAVADRGRPPRLDVIVVTRSRRANAAAVATARNAGATVLELPHADARRVPSAARTLAARDTSPVIALGTPFMRGFAYSLSVVRAKATQPTGGYLALPGKHYTAMYGHPGTPALGVLGEQGVQASVKRVQRLAGKYRAVSDAEFVPTFEIIATVASAGPGKDKNYSRETSVATLTPLVDAAEKAGIYVILDLQPGRSDFLTQAKRYRSLLERPHVGLALDPEWRLGPTQKHLRQIGSVRVAEINRVADWLAHLTRSKVLPQKLFVLHQFSLSMIKDRARLHTHHLELAPVIHVDGSGSQAAKRNTWHTLRHGAPKVGWGWKNFVDEDPDMLTAKQTWRTVKPHPDLITYQ